MSAALDEAVLFIGPSWPETHDDPPRSIRVCPPVRRGDVAALLDEPQLPRVIGIVDGAFNECLSVSPKEVVKALDLGVRVFGSSSMGALRAVECEPFGMTGVGQIFAEFRSGRLDADDEVAIVYDPETLHCLTEPLVSLRLNLAAAVEKGVLSSQAAAQVVAIAKGLHFPHRRLSTIIRLFEQQRDCQQELPLRAYLRDSAVDVKRADAQLLVKAVLDFLTENTDGR